MLCSGYREPSTSFLLNFGICDASAAPNAWTAHLSGCFKLAVTAQKVLPVRSFLLLFYFRFLHCNTDFIPLYNTAAPQKSHYCPNLTIAVVFFTDCFQFSGLAVDLSELRLSG